MPAVSEWKRTARQKAVGLGHKLGPFERMGNAFGECARCRSCGAHAIHRGGKLSGKALTESCKPRATMQPTEPMFPYSAGSPLHDHAMNDIRVQHLSHDGQELVERPMTPAEALLWLAGLADSDGNPVLDLRDPCPGVHNVVTGHLSPCFSDWDWWWFNAPPSEGDKDQCDDAVGWVPKQGCQALQDAMVKGGWSYSITQIPPTSYGAQGRVVHFWKDMEDANRLLVSVGSNDANDWLAAMKAMKAAGYE